MENTYYLAVDPFLFFLFLAHDVSFLPAFHYPSMTVTFVQIVKKGNNKESRHQEGLVPTILKALDNSRVYSQYSNFLK